MSRAGCSEDGDFDQWSLIMYRGQVASAIRGKRGQAFLLELITALDALPQKVLIANELLADGNVCAIGSVGVKRGVDMSTIDPYDYDKLASTFGIAHQLVREIEWENDEAGYNCSPAMRWQRMRRWAMAGLSAENVKQVQP